MAADSGASSRAVWVTALGLFGLFVLLFAGLQYATPGIIGTDGYYHAKMGLLVRQQGLTPTPPHSSTVLNQADFYNHHLLYHLYLALFATVDPAVDGGIALTNQVKLASLFSGSGLLKYLVVTAATKNRVAGFMDNGPVWPLLSPSFTA